MCVSVDIVSDCTAASTNLLKALVTSSSQLCGEVSCYILVVRLNRSTPEAMIACARIVTLVFLVCSSVPSIISITGGGRGKLLIYHRRGEGEVVDISQEGGGGSC